jgi:hypothetical protein
MQHRSIANKGRTASQHNSTLDNASETELNNISVAKRGGNSPAQLESEHDSPDPIHVHFVTMRQFPHGLSGEQGDHREITIRIRDVLGQEQFQRGEPRHLAQFRIHVHFRPHAARVRRD